VQNVCNISIGLLDLNVRHMLNFQRHCNSKLVVQEAELRCTPCGVQTTKVGVRCTPMPPGGAAYVCDHALSFYLVVANSELQCMHAC